MNSLSETILQHPHETFEVRMWRKGSWGLWQDAYLGLTQGERDFVHLTSPEGRPWPYTFPLDTEDEGVFEYLEMKLEVRAFSEMRALRDLLDFVEGQPQHKFPISYPANISLWSIKAKLAFIVLSRHGYDSGLRDELRKTLELS